MISWLITSHHLLYIHSGKTNKLLTNLPTEDGQNGTIAKFTKIYINLPLFQKYVGIYHFLGTWVLHGTLVP